ncbi:electron transfer flavoprotein subunit alpha/FixB family protein [Uniformispora flossi]|uniref:electron transfer flavoprotein subunit alpha/FixB family protein n=1 Tax=Uniformispora flossi TaxID=3390723 RepID=UPI003C2E0FE7
MRPVLVLVERDGGASAVGGADGAVRASAFRLLTLARRLGDPVAVVCHPVAAYGVDALARFGAARICVAEPADPDGKDSAAQSAVALEALTELAWQMDASAVLVPSGRLGREVAARLAVRLGGGIVTGAVDVRPGPDGPVAVQEVCGGTYRVESAVRGGTPVIAVDTGAGEAEPDPVDPVVERMFVSLAESSRRVRCLARRPKADRRPGVAGASVVVAGGRGVGSAEGFTLIEKVADALGGAVGGTHTAADRGWCPQDALIGQTGAVVHPRLYLACGISGSVHHRAGMHHAATIVAIDTDPEAPIFRIADVGVVGDLHDVLPALLAAIARQRTAERGGPTP